MAEKQLYTPEGFKKLTDELNYLKTVKREEIKEAIAVAKGFGDLSENAEYDEARTEQAKTEARITELEALVENAVVEDESKIDTSVISLGSAVVIYDEDEDEEIKYSIVGSVCPSLNNNAMAKIDTKLVSTPDAMPMSIAVRLLFNSFTCSYKGIANATVAGVSK